GFGFTQLTPGSEPGRKQGNVDVVNDTRLVGSPRDIASIHKTQDLISGITGKSQHLPELPARVSRRIDRHLSDMRSAFNPVRAYSAQGAPVGQFSFTREVVDATGNTVPQSVATVPVPMTTRPVSA